MIEVSFSDRTGRAPRHKPALTRLLRSSLLHLGISRAEISILLVTDPAMRRLNRKYRGLNRATDVLSFGQEDPVQKVVRHLGDIVISTTTARRQAKEQGRSLRDELALLAVHGLLHLLGYDHLITREARIMFGLQKKLLRRGGYVS